MLESVLVELANSGLLFPRIERAGVLERQPLDVLQAKKESPDGEKEKKNTPRAREKNGSDRIVIRTCTLCIIKSHTKY